MDHNFDHPPTPVSEATTFESPDILDSPVASSSTQDVAIVGMSCRTAGDNNTPEKLWRFLMEQRSASGEVPRKRWEPWLRRDPRNAKVIDNTPSKGYFIPDLENFDAAFFGISPKEAELMDPHQRLALELSWEALEHAGIDPRELAGSDTAVFMGVDSDDYSRLIMEDLPNIEAWSGLGTGYHGVPNRISYHFDLMGPSMAIDAACASSLIALHLGRQAILSRESTVALCGGVNVLCAPGLTYMLHKAGALSPDGVCTSFDDDAHGYARGEGGAIIVLKSLTRAVADGDNILAVLKGTATAQDGRTNGIMAPNARAQEMVARQALRRSGDIEPSTIGYVEAHATSTALGDPIEITAISTVYGIGRPHDAPCLIGSIKPNVGHLEAAAGAIGFVKAVLAVNKGELAPQALLKKLNTRISWKKSGLKVVQEPSEWLDEYGLRRAAVCSYGYGGSVAHAIIEQTPTAYVAAQALKETDANKHADSVILLVLSSFQEKRLAAQASLLADWLAVEGRSKSLLAIANTLARCRTAQDYRAAFVARNHEEAIESLRNFANGISTQWSSISRILGSTVKRDVVWVFSGHGAQWPNMGKDLLGNSMFYEAVSALDGIIQEELGFSALEILQTGDLGGSARIQVLTYVVQIGLADVLKSKGITPQAIIGHSVGEIAASVTAGCLSREEGALVICRRAKLYAQIEGQGGMALVQLPFAQVADELHGHHDIVAAIDASPYSCVVSGKPDALEQYLSALSSRGIKTFRVKTDVPFHSQLLERLIHPLSLSLIGALDPRPADILIYSTSDLDPRTTTLRNIDYWSGNMVYPVRLCEAIQAAVSDGFRIFLEVSTHAIVTHSISETLDAHGLQESAVIGTMSRNAPAEQSILHAIAQLHTVGAFVDFETQLGTSHWATDVPGMPWVHKPYWKEVETGALCVVDQHDADKHTLLGKRIQIARTDTRIFTTILDGETKPYPLTHPLDGTEIIPAAVYCNTFHHATGAIILDDLRLLVPTPITTDQREVQVVIEGNFMKLLSRLRPNQASSNDSQHTWTEHSRCIWSKPDIAALQACHEIDRTMKRIGTRLPNSFAWEFLQKIGVSGIAYPWAVLEHYGNAQEMIVKMDMDPGHETVQWDAQSWAPFLDAATSVGSSIFFNDPTMRIVSRIDRVQFLSAMPPPKVGYLYIEQASDEKSLAAHISVLSGDGVLLAKLQSMRFSEVEAVSNRATGVDALVHQLAWTPPTFTEKPLCLDYVVLVCSDSELSRTFATDLQSSTRMLVQATSTKDFNEAEVASVLLQKDTVVIYVPEGLQSIDNVRGKSLALVWEATSLIGLLSALPSCPKLFIITNNISKAASSTALAQAPLYGFARIAAQEYPEIWGGLIDNKGSHFPSLAVKYVQGHDVIRIQDELPCVVRLRPFTRQQRYDTQVKKSLLPKTQGTYIVTGGFGDLGLEVLDFLAASGACRIVVVSRRTLPPRRGWLHASGQMKAVIEKIQKLESKGTTIYAIALDIGSTGADEQLLSALDRLYLPPVLGVIHAAGINEDGLIKDTTLESFERVFHPKVAGALILHKAFPPTTLDFFILFSSIGQLVGTTGQSPYGAANSFLDVLATHRRAQGDNAIAIQWTAWRGMGLATDSKFLTTELESKGITDITPDEAFQAWEHLSNYDTDHAVVTRTRILDADEPIPFPLVSDIVQRRAPTTSLPPPNPANSLSGRPQRGPELKTWLTSEIKKCIAAVIYLDVEEIDTRAAIADLGVDSVMSVGLRQKLQSVLGIKVPPSLMWKEPTVGHLVEWFYERLVEKEDGLLQAETP